MKPRPLFELSVCVFLIKVGDDTCQHFQRFIRIDNSFWLGIERRGLDVGGKDFAVPVCQVRAGGNLLLNRSRLDGIDILETEINKPRRNGPIDGCKAGHGNQDTIPGPVRRFAWLVDQDSPRFRFRLFHPGKH